MEFVLLGIGIGMVTVLAPGPVALSLVEVSLSRGRRAGLFGALGIVGGDVVTAGLAIAVVLSGALLPASVLSGLAVVSAAIIACFGALLLARPTASQTIASAIHQPGRTFFSFVTLTPTFIGGYVALFSAMPFGPSLSPMIRLALGVVLVSCIWHPALATVSSWVGPRLTSRRRLALSRTGGFATFVLGLWLLIG